METRGYIQVYTGDGKGKTTAAIGLALRALGAGKKVLFLQFMKKAAYSEHKILSTFSPRLVLKAMGKPFFVIEQGAMPEAQLAEWRQRAVVFPPGKPPKEYVDLMAAGLDLAKTAVSSGEFDVVILDELVVAQRFGLVEWPAVKGVLEAKDPRVEVVLTGRGAAAELIEMADLVTEMREVKHYYTQGVIARRGIEN